MRTEIEFEINKAKILNANVSKHPMVKGKIVSYLKNRGAEEGIEMHPKGEQRELAKRHLAAVQSENGWILMKKRARSKLKKGSLGTEKEINAHIEEVYALEKPVEMPADVPVQHLFKRFSVSVTVCPPTKRRLDPPNLYPTVKPLIDGLTEAGVWPDDSFDYMDEMSFRYGGVSEKADTFIIRMVIEEVA